MISAMGINSFKAEIDKNCNFGFMTIRICETSAIFAPKIFFTIKYEIITINVPLIN